jgi:hypothetical protein
MPHVEFPYLGYPIPASDPFPDGQLAYRPIAAASLIGPSGRRLRCLVCLDSGADTCIFPASFAPVLGLDMLTLKRNFTAGVGSSGNPTAYEDIEVDLGSELRFHAYVGFSPGMNALGLGLLGQAGFFDKFDVCFHHARRIFTIGQR